MLLPEIGFPALQNWLSPAPKLAFSDHLPPPENRFTPYPNPIALFASPLRRLR
jgi:hypothetical protein